MEYFLYGILIVVIVYLLCGVILLTSVILYVKGTPEDPKHARMLLTYSECKPKGKAYIWLVAIWYAVICWAPMALGWMKSPTEILNWKIEK